jgi:hypothetical protein
LIELVQKQGIAGQNKRLSSLLHQKGKRGLELAFIARIRYVNFQTE